MGEKDVLVLFQDCKARTLGASRNTTSSCQADPGWVRYAVIHEAELRRERGYKYPGNQDHLFMQALK